MKTLAVLIPFSVRQEWNKKINPYYSSVEELKEDIKTRFTGGDVVHVDDYYVYELEDFRVIFNSSDEFDNKIKTQYELCFVEIAA